jgi:hypothetical protein
MLEDIGNVAVQSKNEKEAIASYSAALSLKPPNPVRLLVKRSQARAKIMLWEDALKDADDVWLFHLFVCDNTEFQPLRKSRRNPRVSGDTKEGMLRCMVWSAMMMRLIHSNKWLLSSVTAKQEGMQRCANCLRS